MNMQYTKGQIVDYVSLDLDDSFSPCEPQRWYVLRTFSNREQKVMRVFRQRGISAYFPVVRRCAVVRGRRVDVASPLFAGIILIPDFQARLGGVFVEGVEGYFTMGECYPYLTPKLINDVRTLEAIGSIPVSRRKRLWSVGQLVRIADGPFAGFQGSIERLDSRGRLNVLVDIFKRLTPASFEESQIEPA